MKQGRVISGWLSSLSLLLLSPPQHYDSQVNVIQYRSWSPMLVRIWHGTTRKSTKSGYDIRVVKRNDTMDHPNTNSLSRDVGTFRINEENNNNNKDDEWLYNETNWKEHPDLYGTIAFRTWMVPINNGQSTISKLLKSNMIKPYLATQLDLIQHLHTRFRLIRDCDSITTRTTTRATTSTNHHMPYPHPIESNNNPDDHDDEDDNNKCNTSAVYKLILLHPDTPSCDSYDLPLSIKEILQQGNIQDGPLYPITFRPEQLTASYILNKVLPPSVHPIPTSFETIGHIAHLNLKSHHIPYAKLIGTVLYESLPNIKTVLYKSGEVTGPYRTYPYQIIAGDNSTNNTSVQLIENGISLSFDIAHVYWCSRLSEERKRLLENEIILDHSILVDAFCGVGALCIQAAKYKNCIILANDWNPHAISSLQRNILQNQVQDSFPSIQCMDAYEFLVDIGLMVEEQQQQQQQPTIVYNNPSTLRNNNNQRNKKKKRNRSNHRNKKGYNILPTNQCYARLPDHVILNYPLEAVKFLSALRWWPTPHYDEEEEEQHDDDTDHDPSANHKQYNHDDPNDKNMNITKKRRSAPRIHVYTFVRGEKSTIGTGKQLQQSTSMEIMAVNLVADHLLSINPTTLSSLSNVDNLMIDMDDYNEEPSRNEKRKDDDSDDIPDVSITTTATTLVQEKNRLHELNEEYNCQVNVHHVRDVAPGKVVMCVSFYATPKLIRHMRGDFR
jgi:tRNA G37 N-methylase Trm5